MASDRKIASIGGALASVVIAIVLSGYFADPFRVSAALLFGTESARAVPVPEPKGKSGAPVDPFTASSVELSATQLSSVKVEPVGEHTFPLEKETVGSIDFNQEMLVQVFSQYQGKIIDLFASIGDEVKKGQTLFTIDSPDLLQAESTLIAAAGVLDFTTRTLERATNLIRIKAIAQKELDQATSDQQTAEGALKAARDAVRIFGKSDAEIDRMVKARKVDPILIVPSPISGRVTARNAAPGQLAQPGSQPPPFSVADLSTVWMLANVAEVDIPAFHVGQDVKVSVMAFPGRVFKGKISVMGATVDPTTHRVVVRSEVGDPRRELRPGMFATFVVQVGNPVRAVAAPLDGVVREGDGTMVVWVTTDRRHFVRRAVKVGQQRDGYHEILDGLRPGELIATEGALLLSNALTSASR